MRRDLVAEKATIKDLDFYSRASCEARLAETAGLCIHTNFYSRASCEARPVVALRESGADDFYSRASCEARQATYLATISC